MGKELIQKEQYHYKCNECKEYTEEGVITVQFGYGSILDGEDLSFCSDECLKKWCTYTFSIGEKLTALTGSKK